MTFRTNLNIRVAEMLAMDSLHVALVSTEEALPSLRAPEREEQHEVAQADSYPAEGHDGDVPSGD